MFLFCLVFVSSNNSIVTPFVISYHRAQPVADVLGIIAAATAHNNDSFEDKRRAKNAMGAIHRKVYRFSCLFFRVWVCRCGRREGSLFRQDCICQWSLADANETCVFVCAVKSNTSHIIGWFPSVSDSQLDGFLDTLRRSRVDMAIVYDAFSLGENSQNTITRRWYLTPI